MPDLQLLEELSIAWIKVKTIETAANKERVAVEKQLLELYEFNKPDGSKTFSDITESDTLVKVTITNKMNFKLDIDAYSGVKDPDTGLTIEELIPLELRPVDYVPKLIPAAIKWLKENELEIARKLARCITEKPAKSGVKVVRSSLS